MDYVDYSLKVCNAGDGQKGRKQNRDKSDSKNGKLNFNKHLASVGHLHQVFVWQSTGY